MPMLIGAETKASAKGWEVWKCKILLPLRVRKYAASYLYNLFSTIFMSQHHLARRPLSVAREEVVA
jgi:hypothetical protein